MVEDVLIILAGWIFCALIAVAWAASFRDEVEELVKAEGEVFKPEAYLVVQFIITLIAPFALVLIIILAIKSWIENW